MSGTVAEWVERARYDLETAKTLLESGRYLYVLFCCQQAVEKAVKAVIVHKTGEMPPRIHNLTKLTTIAGLYPEEDTSEYLAALSSFYIQTRYPEEFGLPPSLKNVQQFETILKKAGEVTEWLFSMLK